jgi:hypothetical protein
MVRDDVEATNKPFVAWHGTTSYTQWADGVQWWAETYRTRSGPASCLARLQLVSMGTQGFSGAQRPLKDKFGYT